MINRQFAVCCDLSGRIRTVLRDDLGLLNREVTSALLSAIATESSATVCLAMLEEIRREQAVYGWLLEVQSSDGPVSLHFAGALQDDQIIVIACEEFSEIPRFTEEILRVNNEHVAALRRLQKDAALRASASSQYAGLSELNNQVTALQRQLAMKTRQLEDALRERNLLLGIAAHDLRGPIGSIANFAASLRRSDSLTDRQRLSTEWIERLSNYMSRVLLGVLSTTAISEGRLQLQMEEANLSDVIEAAVECARPLAEMHGVRIAWKPDPCHCSVDAPRLTQAVSNLIDNAIKAAPEGTKVEISSTQAGSHVSVQVRDYGQGIPPESREAIFRAFESTAESSEAASAFGLGLHIAGQVVSAHNGRLELDCPADGGTIFTIILPAV